MEAIPKTKIITFPSKKGSPLPKGPKLSASQMKKFLKNLPTHIDFNAKFFTEFFSRDCNIDLLLRLVNSVLIDMYYAPLTKFTSNSWYQGADDETGKLTSAVGVGGVTEHGDYYQVVLHPMENPLSPDFAGGIYGGAYEIFKEVVPKEYKKKSLHYVFLLNHLFDDPLDNQGLLKKDFHIISTPPAEYIPTHFSAGDLVVHFIQLPRLFTSNVKNTFLDLVLFLSIFINVTLEYKPDKEARDYFYKIDPDMRRVWEAYREYVKK